MGKTMKPIILFALLLSACATTQPPSRDRDSGSSDPLVVRMAHGMPHDARKAFIHARGLYQDEYGNWHRRAGDLLMAGPDGPRRAKGGAR